MLENLRWLQRPESQVEALVVYFSGEKEPPGLFRREVRAQPSLAAVWKVVSRRV